MNTGSTSPRQSQSACNACDSDSRSRSRANQLEAWPTWVSQPPKLGAFPYTNPKKGVPSKKDTPTCSVEVQVEDPTAKEGSLSQFHKWGLASIQFPCTPNCFSRAPPQESRPHSLCLLSCPSMVMNQEPQSLKQTHSGQRVSLNRGACPV